MDRKPLQKQEADYCAGHSGWIKQKQRECNGSGRNGSSWAWKSEWHHHQFCLQFVKKEVAYMSSSEVMNLFSESWCSAPRGEGGNGFFKTFGSFDAVRCESSWKCDKCSNGVYPLSDENSFLIVPTLSTWTSTKQVHHKWIVSFNWDCKTSSKNAHFNFPKIIITVFSGATQSCWLWFPSDLRLFSCCLF